MKLKDMPPLNAWSYKGPMIPMTGDTAPTVVTMPTDEQMHRVFALHAASQVLPDRPIGEICEAARFIEDGSVFPASAE